MFVRNCREKRLLPAERPDGSVSFSSNGERVARLGSGSLQRVLTWGDGEASCHIPCPAVPSRVQLGISGSSVPCPQKTVKGPGPQGDAEERDPYTESGRRRARV